MKPGNTLFERIWHILWPEGPEKPVVPEKDEAEVLYRMDGILRQAEPDYGKLWEGIAVRLRGKGRTRRWWLQRTGWAAVAVVGLTAGMLAWYPRTSGEQEALPEARGVRLTLADGKSIDLGKTGAEKILEKEGIMIRKDTFRAALAYETTGKNTAKTGYNVLDIPVAAEYSLVMADGTKVVLNSESRLRYPTVFDGGERRVYLEGEGYFEVARDTLRPFIVVTGQLEVQALGTAFNINAYQDDGTVRTTLVEGKVAVSNGGERVVLLPGTQAVADASGLRVHQVDCLPYIAWKEGLFVFNRMPLEDIMLQMRRWYGIETVFRQEELRHCTFTGMIDRNLSPEETFRVIEKTIDIRFDKKGNTVVVY